MSKTTLHVLVVDDNKETTHYLSMLLEAEQWKVTAANTGKSAQDLLRHNAYQAILLDYSLPDIMSVDMISFCKQLHPNTPIVMHTGYNEGQVGFEVSRAGADHFLAKGAGIVEIKSAIEQCVMKQKAVKVNKKVQLRQEPLQHIIGNSAPIKQLKSDIVLYANTNSSALIIGPNGSGKEAVAAGLHALSARASKPYIVDNAAGGNEQMVDSRYFGHFKGAFTDASSDYEGLFRMADNGSLFIDEIGNMPLASQQKMLRASQFKEIIPLGIKSKPIKVDVRLITATNKDLLMEIEKGHFMLDFYHRISTVLIEVPSLNERIEDLPLLADHFLAMHCTEESRNPKVIAPEVMDLLMTYNWTGNVRELSSVIHNAILTSGEQEVLTMKDFRRLKLK
jgi:DNA-binding NtrC family response regulator